MMRRRCRASLDVLRSVLTTLLIAVGAIVFAHPLTAQSVEGTLIDAESRQPLEGAMVVLLDMNGSTMRSVLTNDRGRFVLRAPAPGDYVLRADRIGHESVTSPTITLRGDEVLNYSMEVGVRPISLAGIQVDAGPRRCDSRPARNTSETARVWEEARKALAVTHWVQENRPLRFVGETFVRVLDPVSRRVIEENVRAIRGYSAQPFVSLGAEDLATGGYVRTADGGRFYDFYAPSAEVLLSDAFLATHCMHVVQGDAGSAMIGVAFEPVRGRRVADIRGTFWLDAQTAELRYLEFTYAGVDDRVPVQDAGGRVDFAALSTGAWIVSEWVIRMPAVAQQQVSWMGQSRMQTRVVNVREEGGEVRQTLDAAGRAINRAAGARIVGVVRDSTTGTVLANAQVRLSGTSRMAVTDAAGRFEISEVPNGTYAIEFNHAKLDSLPLAALRPTPIIVRGESELHTELAVPPLSRIIATACPLHDDSPDMQRRLRGETSVLVGRVFHGRTRLPAAGIAVSVGWTATALESGAPGYVIRSEPFTVTAETADDGRFWMCDLPRHTTLRARVELPDGTRQTVTFRLTDAVQTVSIDGSDR